MKQPLKNCEKDKEYWYAKLTHFSFIAPERYEDFIGEICDYYEGELKIADNRFKVCEQEHKDCV